MKKSQFGIWDISENIYCNKFLYWFKLLNTRLWKLEELLVAKASWEEFSLTNSTNKLMVVKMKN